MKIVFIHGAGATADSFNFIEPKLDKRFDREFIQYDSNNGFKNNLKLMIDQQISTDEELFFVSHSLGGLYALHLGEYLNGAVVGSVSISSPFNGSESASVLNMIKPCQLYSDISPYADPIYGSRSLKITYPWTQIVTTGGKSHWMDESNDGVVTKKSMMIRKDMEFIEINTNHYEVMMNREVIDVINKKIKAVYK